MTLKQLEYFLAIAETGSITQAAETLHVSQPPMSLQLKALEDEFGVSLFDRTRRGLAITQSGRLLEQRAQEIFELIDQTINEVRSKTASPKVEIRIGTINSVSNRLIPSWIYNYESTYPNVDIQVSEASTTDILFYLDEHRIDLGIVREPFNKARYNYRQIHDEALGSHQSDCFVALADPGFYAGFEEDTIPLSELRDFPLLLHRRYISMFTKYCRSCGFIPNIICKNNDVMSLLSWAKAGIGIAVLPYSSSLLNTDSRLVRKDIIDPVIPSRIYVVWDKEVELSAEAEHFLSLISQKSGKDKASGEKRSKKSDMPAPPADALPLKEEEAPAAKAKPAGKLSGRGTGNPPEQKSET